MAHMQGWMTMTTLFGNDLVRSLMLGFALGSAAMTFVFGAQSAQAIPLATKAVVEAGR